MTHDPQHLDHLRTQIDSIDTEIIRLLNERFSVVHEVGKYKRERNESIYVPEREKFIFGQLQKKNEGGIVPNDVLNAIYREIMSGAISIEKPIKVAFLGPQASYSHLAATTKFGRSVTYCEQNSIIDVFTEVETGRVDYGCVPVENSSEGVVNSTLDTLIGTSAKICAEINLKVHHNLMAFCPIEEIEVVYSHPQVLGQCRQWINTHLPHARIEEAPSSSLAAMRVAENKGKMAAIASSLAAEIYDIPIIQRGIEDCGDNTTRFYVIGNQSPLPTGDDKTSICFGLRDRVGALYEALMPFRANQVTLTMIESRPSRRRNWEYVFFVDILGHTTDPHIAQTLVSLKNNCLFMRELGSYPSSVNYGAK